MMWRSVRRKKLRPCAACGRKKTKSKRLATKNRQLLLVSRAKGMITQSELDAAMKEAETIDDATTLHQYLTICEGVV